MNRHIDITGERCCENAIYLDNAATTQMAKEVEEAMEPYLRKNFGNASAIYSLGEEAKEVIEGVRIKIAKSLDAKPSEIYFTSGGSESDNWAVKGIAGACKTRGSHIITSRIEHHAILNSCQYLEHLGYEVTYLDVDGEGMVSPGDVAQAVRPGTTLITIMFANNEIGTIEPITQIGRFARECGILFHTDAVQAYAQIPISVRHYPVDLLSASAHKFHGPKGVGFLYIREGIQIPSFIHGGGQEKGKRAGTENVPGIVGMGRAVELAFSDMKKRVERELALRDYLIGRVVHEIPGVRINGHPVKRLPGNVSMSFSGIDGASLLILLDEDGICASGGSACNTGESRISYVIEAIGVSEVYAAGTVRMTLCKDTTRADIDAAVYALKRNIKRLRE
ncbi:MAG: cysteine desulfurase family protein [Roseburia sp.]